MDREHDWNLAGDTRQSADQSLERVGVVHVARPVQREHRVGAARQPKGLRHMQGARPLTVRQQRVDHDVADEMDLLRRHAFGTEVLCS